MTKYRYEINFCKEYQVEAENDEEAFEKAEELYGWDADPVQKGEIMHKEKIKD